MLTSVECLTRAADMAERAAKCDEALANASYLRIARGWRRAALMAQYQDEWFALNETPA
jgi:hypothetical protein